MDLEAKREHTAIREGDSDQMPSWREVFLYFLMLGFINIGGPVAQITMMYNHMVERRHWLSEDRFVKIMAFCHMLPGPEALQLAIYVGYLKRRLLGGKSIDAALGFVTVVTMGLIVLPTMLRHGYDKRLAAGTVAATATLAQIFPPATVLVLLGVFLRSMSRQQTNWTFEDTLSQIGFGYVPLFLLGFVGAAC
jgi:chromate transporter